MKKIFVFLITLSIFACSNDKENDDFDLGSEAIKLTYDRSWDKEPETNGPLLPNINTIEDVGENSEIGKNIIKLVDSFNVFNVDYTKIERITMVNENSTLLYSIPILNELNSYLILAVQNNRLNLTLARLKELDNGNSQYSIFNQDDKLVFQIEKDKNSMLGNLIITENSNGYFYSGFDNFDSNSSFEKKESCLLTTNTFNSCMQCAWDECTSSWVCGAVLALKPLQVIAFSAAICGLNSLVN